MRLLAIETATEACSAALSIGNEVIERYVVAPREHASLILPMIDEILDEAGIARAQLDVIAFGRGPGSFTGLRIAAGVTQGIALALDLPVVRVSTLASLALQAFEALAGDHVYACLDARMSEIYGGLYSRGPIGLPEVVGVESVLPAETVEAGTRVDIGIGSGWMRYRDVLYARLGRGVNVLENRFPRASHVARLGVAAFAAGDCVEAAEAIPAYLRDRVARKPST